MFSTLLHSHISCAIEGNMPLKLLAENVGTSVAQIEKTYCKFLADVGQELIDAKSPKLPKSKVLRIV